METVELKIVNIAKIDVEGTELDVLLGAKEAFAGGKIEKLVVEIHTTINDPLKVVDFLGANGFSLDGLFKVTPLKCMGYFTQRR